MLVPDAIAPTGERAKLLDFGLAKLAKDTNSQLAVTRSHHIMGTPLYMSPEQCRGAGIVDDKSDVYSLGVMLYQMLAGRPPFSGEGVGELISHHISDEPPPLAELAPQAPAELVLLVHRLLRKDRTRRPSMHQIVAELERLEARQGSAGTRKAAVTAASSADLEIPNVKLRDLLAEALEPETEDERSVQATTDSLQPAMAYERTLSSGDHSPSGARLNAAGMQFSDPPSMLLRAPTMISGPISTTVAGESPQRSFSSRQRRSLVMGLALCGVGLTATLWFLQPVHPRLPSVTVHPASPARQLATPAIALPTAAGMPADKGILAAAANSAASPALPTPPVEVPPVRGSALEVAKQPLKKAAAVEPGQRGLRPKHMRSIPTAAPQIRNASNPAAERDPARPASSPESKPADAPQKSRFQIID